MLCNTCHDIVLADPEHGRPVAGCPDCAVLANHDIATPTDMAWVRNCISQDKRNDR